MLCKKCHTEMIAIQEDNVGGLICPKCGWNIVATKIDDIMLDTKIYQLYALKNENINMNQIRVLSKISGANYSKRLNFRHGYKNPRPHFCNRSTLIIHI